jgi:hypothetical protein
VALAAAPVVLGDAAGLDALLAGVLPEDPLLAGAVLAAAELAAACVEPGRIAATTPAVTTPAAPTVTVTARRWPWLRCRWNTAARTSALRWFIEVPLRSVIPGQAGSWDR